MALWRLEKLPQVELKARLRAAGLSEVGTKRLLAQRLQSHLQAQPPPSSESSGDESSERPSSSSEEEKSEETDGGAARSDHGANGPAHASALPRPPDCPGRT